MIDWTRSMKRSYKFYEVDPSTWKNLRHLDTITSCKINRDTTKSTLGSGTFNTTTEMDECYIRVYLVVVQDGVSYDIPLATLLVQTPSVGFDGKKRNISMDAYTPLVELKGSQPPIGYSLLEGDNIMDMASRLCRENMRAPVIAAKNNDKLTSNFVSNLDDEWLTFISDLIDMAEYQFHLDEMGRVLFKPIQDIASLQPVWTYNDDNTSILLADIDDDRDLYDMPNVVEVIYSTGAAYMRSRAVNDDKNSPISTVNRGRELVRRITNPSFAGIPTQEQIDDYAVRMLRNLSCLEHTVTYTHAYCPVREGDCVLLNYTRFGLVNVKAKVISQSITCDTDCLVEETAVYTTRLWR